MARRRSEDVDDPAPDRKLSPRLDLVLTPVTRVDQACHEVFGIQVRTLADHDRLGVFDLGAEPLQKCADRSNDQEGCGLCAGVPLGRGAGR